MEIQLNLDMIILYVQDVERLTSFYTSIFKLNIIEKHQSLWALLNAGNGKIGLHKIGSQYLEQERKPVRFNNNAKIVFEVDEDINDVREYLLGQNVLMKELKTFENYDYWLCDGEDPEGNIFQLKQKKIKRTDR